MAQPGGPHASAPRVLIAGVGNIFLRDDGFGSEVVRAVTARPLPPEVRAVDYGIGGIHLAYDLLTGVDRLILVDALPHDAPPGTVTLVEVDPGQDAPSTVDSHAMDPATVFASLRGLGGEPPPTVLVGCQPADVSEGMGLSQAVADAVGPAVEHVLGLAAQAVAELAADGAMATDLRHDAHTATARAAHVGDPATTTGRR